MKVLVTGATGLIGSRLVRKLRDEGHGVTVLSRDPSHVEASLGVSCPAFAWSPTQGEPPAQAFDGVEAIIHLAGEPVAGGRWTAEKKKRIRDSRVLGTSHLVGAIQKLGKKPRVLVSASAIGYYGNRGDEILDESSSRGEGFLASVCEEWEAPTRALQELRVVNPRTGIVLSPDGGALEKILAPFKLGLGGRVGSGKQWMSWIHIDDLISALLECLTNSALSGPVNMVAPEPVTNSDFTKVLSDTLRKPAALPVPSFALELALGEMSQLALWSQRVEPGALKRANFRFRFQTLERALGELLSHD